MTYDVRPLGLVDAASYRRVRLDSLRLHPEAFGADYDDEARQDPAQFAERLTMPGFTRFGGFADRDLIGLAGLQIRSGTKERHKAYLFSMYVDAAHRGSGLAQRLVEAVVSGARDAGCVVLHLSVTVVSAPSRRFYRRMGFTVYGLERRSLLVDGVYLDEELMALDLD